MESSLKTNWHGLSTGSGMATQSESCLRLALLGSPPSTNWFLLMTLSVNYVVGEIVLIQVPENVIFPWASSGTSESVYSIIVSHPVCHITRASDAHRWHQVHLFIASGEEADMQAERSGLWWGKGHKPPSAAALWHKLPPAHSFSYYYTTADHNISAPGLQKDDNYKCFWRGQAH